MISSLAKQSKYMVVKFTFTTAMSILVSSMRSWAVPKGLPNNIKMINGPQKLIQSGFPKRTHK